MPPKKAHVDEVVMMQDLKFRRFVDMVHIAVRHRNDVIHTSGRWTCVCVSCERVRALIKDHDVNIP